jgi:hypothetical protein
MNFSARVAKPQQRIYEVLCGNQYFDYLDLKFTDVRIFCWQLPRLILVTVGY